MSSLSDLSGAPSLFGRGGGSSSSSLTGGLVPLDNKPKPVVGSSDFDALLDIIEEDEKPKKKSSKSSASSKSKSKSSKDKDTKSKKSSSKKGSSTSSKVSKSSVSSRAGSRSSDEELEVSSDDLADVDIEHDPPARPRTGGLDRPAAGASETERPRSAGDSSAAGRRRAAGFDPLTPTKEGNESEQSPGQNHVLSFFRDDGGKGQAEPDLDSLSSDLSDILGVSIKPARVGRRRAAREEEEKLEKEAQERQEAEAHRQRQALLAREQEEQRQRQEAERQREEAERQREEELGRAQEEARQAALERDRRDREDKERQQREKREEAERQAQQAEASGTRSSSRTSNPNARDSPLLDDQVDDRVGASSFTEDSPPLARKEGAGGRGGTGRHLHRSPSPAGKETPTPPRAARSPSPGAAQDSFADSVTSVNFEESADAEEVMRMLEQGPMSKPKAPAAAKEPAPAPAPTSTTTTTTSSSSSRASANVAAGGGGQGKGGDSGSSPAGYVPFDFAARQPRLGRRSMLNAGSALPLVGGATAGDGRTSPSALQKDPMRAESPVLSLEARLAQRLGQALPTSAQDKGGSGGGAVASPKPPRSPSPAGTSPKLDGVHAPNHSPSADTGGSKRGTSEQQAGTLLQRRGQSGPTQLLSVTSPVAAGATSNPPSTGSSASRRRGGVGSAGDKGRGGRNSMGSVGSGEDSWGAAETEAALAKVKELEQKAAQEERKRKAAEERALALSSQSAELIRSKEEKEELAQALELQMRELAQARQADAMRSSREIEAATIEDMKARKQLEDELAKERAMRKESEHKVEVLEQEVARVKARAEQAESAGGRASEQQAHLDQRAQDAEAQAAQVAKTNASLVAKVSGLQDAQTRLEEELQAAASRHTKAIAALKHEHLVELQTAQSEAANLKSEVLRLQGELDRARDKAVLEVQDSTRQQLDHVKQLHERDKEWRESQHREEVAALTARYESRIEQLQAERSQGQSLETIMQTVATSAQHVRELGQAMEHERTTSLDEKEAAYRARAALLQDKESRLSAFAAQLDKDRANNLSLQLTIEQMSEQATSSLEQERSRLAQEHARLERMQRSLETERQLVKETLGSELKRMEEESTMRRQEHQAFVTEIARERKALADQRSTLLQQEADLRQRHEASSKDLDVVRERLDQERLAHIAEAEKLAKDKAALRNELDMLSLERASAADANVKVQQEMQQIRTLAEELEGRARQVATVKEESERAMQEAALLVEAARRAQEETAVERVEYQEKQVAADDAKKQLDRDKADLVSARAALNAGLKNAQLREEAARMVQSRLSAHIRPHAGGSSGLGGMRQWRQSESASATYGNPYLDLSGSPLSHHRPGDHAPLASASGLELGGDAGASASWNKTRALDMDLDAQGGQASFAQELAQVEHERNKSKAYVRSQMQFLMVLASTETHTSSDTPPSHVAAGFSGHAQGAEMEKDAGDWSSHSGRGGSKSMAYEPVSMLQSQTFSTLKSHTCLPDSAPEGAHALGSGMPRSADGTKQSLSLWQDDSGASGGWEKSTGVTQGSDNDNSELVSMLQSTLHSQKA